MDKSFERGGRSQADTLRANDTRSEEARLDFENRKHRMLELAEERNCLPAMRIMLLLADVQAGFADEQIIFDYNRREAEKRGKGEWAKTHDAFRSFSTRGSDWLRSIEVLSLAIRAEENVPSLMLVQDLESPEGRVFETWCQKNFLNAHTLVEIMNRLRQDRSVDLSSIQTIPFRDLGRIIVETHLDRLMIVDDDATSRQKGFISSTQLVPLPPQGFTKRPDHYVKLSPRSAVADAIHPTIIVATYLEEVERKSAATKGSSSKVTSQTGISASEAPKKDIFAHGVHQVHADDLEELCPGLLAPYENPWFQSHHPEEFVPHIDRNSGTVVRGVHVHVRGSELADLPDNFFDSVEVYGQEAETVLIDYLMDQGKPAVGRFKFHNLALLTSKAAQEMFNRSGGRAALNDITGFNLRLWYEQRLRLCGEANSTDQLVACDKTLTLTLGDVLGKELAHSIETYCPTEVIINNRRLVTIEYTYDSSASRHAAEICLNASHPEDALSIVNELPKLMPKIGDPKQPPIGLSFVVRTPQYFELQILKPNRYNFDDARGEQNIFPDRRFNNLDRAVDYMEAARIAYAFEHVDSRFVLKSFNPNIHVNILWDTVPFQPEKPFPNAEEIAKAKPIEPLVVARTGEKIIPFPAVIFQPSDQLYRSPDEFGLIWFVEQADADRCEEAARRKWQELGGAAEAMPLKKIIPLSRAQESQARARSFADSVDLSLERERQREDESAKEDRARKETKDAYQEYVKLCSEVRAFYKTDLAQFLSPVIDASLRERCDDEGGLFGIENADQLEPTTLRDAVEKYRKDFAAYKLALENAYFERLEAAEDSGLLQRIKEIAPRLLPTCDLCGKPATLSGEPGAAWDNLAVFGSARLACGCPEGGWKEHDRSGQVAPPLVQLLHHYYDLSSKGIPMMAVSSALTPNRSPSEAVILKTVTADNRAIMWQAAVRNSGFYPAIIINPELLAQPLDTTKAVVKNVWRPVVEPLVSDLYKRTEDEVRAGNVLKLRFEVGTDPATGDPQLTARGTERAITTLFVINSQNKNLIPGTEYYCRRAARTSPDKKAGSDVVSPVLVYPFLEVPPHQPKSEPSKSKQPPKRGPSLKEEKPKPPGPSVGAGRMAEALRDALKKKE